MTNQSASAERNFARGVTEFPSADSAGREPRISHVIPSVTLNGSRAHKLRQLDTLIVYLESLRRTLAGEAPALPRGGFEGPSRYASAPVWPWFLAGMAATALVVLLAIFFMNS